MAEWLIAPVLKTGDSARGPWVQILLVPIMIENNHQFSVTRQGEDFFLKKTIDVNPNIESHIFSSSYKEARKLWHRLIRKDKPIGDGTRLESGRG